MTLHLSLSAHVEALLRERAAALGRSPEDVVLAAVEEHLRLPRNLASALAPIHEQAEHAGMTEAEAADLIARERDGAWRARKSA